MVVMLVFLFEYARLMLIFRFGFVLILMLFAFQENFVFFLKKMRKGYFACYNRGEKKEEERIEN